MPVTDAWPGACFYAAWAWGPRPRDMPLTLVLVLFGLWALASLIP